MIWIINHQYLSAAIVILLLGSIFSLPCFKYLDKDMNNNNITAIRFFLSILVVYSHACFMYKFLQTKLWQTEAGKLLYLGDTAVSGFFIITGYLFSKKIFSNDNINWLALYKDRFFRIAPLSIFNSIIVIIFVIIFYTDFSFHAFNKSLFLWFTFGIISDLPNINDFENSFIFVAGIYWSLVYEWGFYFCLPLLYLFKDRSFQVTLILLFLSFYVLPFLPIQNINLTGWQSTSCAVLFIIGSLCYQLEKRVNFKPLYYDILLVITLASIFVYRPDAYNIHTPQMLILAVIFTCLFKGATGFGFLKLKGFVRLGHCSYSIFIMHGLILYIFFNLSINHLHINPEKNIFTLIIFTIILIICIISSVTYKFVELPFINIGKKLKL